MDPTAFDNLKTVLEGAVYDADLQGRIAVVERRDLVDLARLFREYAISFRLNDAPDPLVVCTARLSLDFAELVNERLYHGRSGCRLAVVFTMPIRRSSVCALIEGTLRTIWGEERIIRQTLRFPFPHERGPYENEAVVEFARLIYEENAADLPEMVPYMISSLEELQPLSGQ
ncbi:hypothetical protein [Geobacillus thermodenitrificans]|uniref:hypothetical protein n=1 Tax=Geobacillus thermodenitrificans TaxID=33940 RepID=UPI0002DA85C3|nr:hypothetical protein [Geobacillus thermodenitrificans]ARP42794.1 hypothetical protein GTHT12_01253 [Geobacillus thermodenitrificans]ATO35926.1 hypothetical protein GTID1_01045 [Geobacillus thermodenitrificans]MED0661819.1 hypothetical protein [Geobacillus thermodenitrificans]